MPRFVFFDLDGVIVHTDRSAFDFYRGELLKKGICISEDDFSLKRGRKSDAFFRELAKQYDLRGIDIEELTQRKRDQLTNYVKKNAVLTENAENVLHSLRNAAFRLV